MFNKLQICLGPIAVLIFLTSLGFSDRREIKPPLREIDVAQKSAPYRTSLGMIVKNVQLAARKRLHLTVDVFSLNSSDADNFSELRYETETADSRIAALPSGRMIASLSQQLILLDERLQVEATSSLNLVCAPQPQLADKEGYVVALFPASEDVAVVSVQPTVNRLVPTETARPLVLVLNARSTSDRADGAFPGHTRNCEGSSHVYGESRKQERFPKRRAVELLRYLVGGSRHLASARIDWPAARVFPPHPICKS